LVGARLNEITRGAVRSRLERKGFTSWPTQKKGLIVNIHEAKKGADVKGFLGRFVGGEGKVSEGVQGKTDK